MIKYLGSDGEYHYATVKDIGDLNRLITTEKTDIVSAINSIANGEIGGGIPSDINDKLDELWDAIENGALNENQLQEIIDRINGAKYDIDELMEKINEEVEQFKEDYANEVEQITTKIEDANTILENTRTHLSDLAEELRNAELNVGNIEIIVDELNLQISSKVDKTEMDLLDSRVERNESEIIQLTDEISSRVTEQELDLVTNRVSEAESKIIQQAGLIEQKVTFDEVREEIDKIDKYNPNLFRNSRDWEDFWEIPFDSDIEGTYQHCHILTVKNNNENITQTVSEIGIGETYTVSIWAKSDVETAELYVLVDGEEIRMADLDEDEAVTDAFARYKASFVATSQTTDISFRFKGIVTSTGYLVASKLEKGNTLSGWQDHVDDNYARTVHNESLIQQTDTKIDLEVKSITEKYDGELEIANTAIQLNKDEISLTNEKIVEVDGLAKQNKSSLELLDNKVEIEVSTIETNINGLAIDLDKSYADGKNRIINSELRIPTDLLDSTLQYGFYGWSLIDPLFKATHIPSDRYSAYNYMAKIVRSGLTSQQVVSVATNAFAVKQEEKITFSFDVWTDNRDSIDNLNIAQIELFDKNDIRVDVVIISVARNNLINNSIIRLNSSYFVNRVDVVKARLRFDLRQNGSIAFGHPSASSGNFDKVEWKPNPDDEQVIQLINSAKFTVTNSEIASRVTKVEWDAKNDELESYVDSTFKVAEDSISGVITKVDDNGVKISSVEQKVNSVETDLQRGVADINREILRIDGDVNEHTNLLQTVTQKVDGINTNGRNLWPYTDYDNVDIEDIKSNYTYPSTVSTPPFISVNTAESLIGTAEYGKAALFYRSKVGEIAQYYINPKENGKDYLTLEPNKDYTFAMDYYHGGGVSSLRFVVWAYDSNGENRVSYASETFSTTYSNKYKRFEFNFKTDARIYYETRVYITADQTVPVGTTVNFSMFRPYLKKGSGNTEWSPNPNDYTTNSVLTAKTNEINQKINENSNSIQLATQTIQKHNDDITSLRSDLTVSDRNITALTGKTDGNTTQIGQLQLSYNGLNSAVASVTSDIAGMEFGSKNWLNGTSFTDSADEVFKNFAIPSWVTKGIVSTRYATMSGSPMYDAPKVYFNDPSPGQYSEYYLNPIDPGYQNIKLNPNTEYTFSFWNYLETPITAARFALWSYDEDRESNRAIVNGTYTLSATTAKPVKQVVKFKTNDSIYYQLRLYYSIDTANTAQYRRVFLSHFMLNEGNKAMPWSPSFDEYTSQAQFSTLNQTVDGIESTVGNVQRGLDGKLDTTQFTSYKQTSDSFQQTVTNRLDSVIVNYVSNGAFENDRRGDNDGWTFANGVGSFYSQSTGAMPTPSGTYLRLSTLNSTTFAVQTFTGNKAIRLRSRTVNFSCYARATNTAIPSGAYFRMYMRATLTDGTYQYFESNLNRDIAVGWKRFSSTATLPSNLTEVNISFQWLNFPSNESVYLTGIQISDGEALLPYTENTIDTPTQSQITQLSNEINLKITKADLDAGILNDKTIKDTRSDNQNPQWYWTNYPKQTVKELKQVTAIGVNAGGATGNFVTLETDVPWNTASGGKITQTAYADNGVYQRFSSSTTAWDTWNKIADSSNIITQINLSKEGVLIDGAKNHITGQTTIDNAVIKSGHIDSLDAGKINATTLSTITTNTGALNVSGNLTMTTDNTVIQGSYDYTEGVGDAYQPRRFTGDSAYGRRFMKYLGTTRFVSGSALVRYSESFYGLDYFKQRVYDNATSMNLESRIDMYRGKIELSQYWATGDFSSTVITNSDITTPVINARDKVTTGRIVPRSDYDTFIINENQVNGIPRIMLSSGNGGHAFENSKRTHATMNVGSDGSNPRVWFNSGVYDRTYSGSANMYVTSEGTIGRVTSARKYKSNIKVASSVIDNAEKILDINPSSWDDKAALERKGISKRYYGFIADEFDERGLNEVVVYGNDGHVESLAYDRIPIYHNVILKNHRKEIASLNNKIQELENQIKALQMS